MSYRGGWAPRARARAQSISPTWLLGRLATDVPGEAGGRVSGSDMDARGDDCALCWCIARGKRQALAGRRASVSLCWLGGTCGAGLGAATGQRWSTLSRPLSAASSLTRMGHTACRRGGLRRHANGTDPKPCEPPLPGLLSGGAGVLQRYMWCFAAHSSVRSDGKAFGASRWWGVARSNTPCMHSCMASQARDP